MYNLLIKPLMMAFALLSAVATLGAAASQTPSKSITATVTFVDAKIGLMQLKLPEDKTLNMAASTQLLNDLKTGQRVNVVVTKKAVAHATDMPPGETSLAEVRKVDKKMRFLRLLTTQGEIVELSPGQQLLDGLQAGDRVQIGIHPALLSASE
jgi:hypothetical protein